MNYKDETVEQALERRWRVFGKCLEVKVHLLFKSRMTDIIVQSDRIIYAHGKDRLEIHDSGEVTLWKGAEDFYLSEEEKTTIKNIIG